MLSEFVDTHTYYNQRVLKTVPNIFQTHVDKKNYLNVLTYVCIYLNTHETHIIMYCAIFTNRYMAYAG